MKIVKAFPPNYSEICKKIPAVKLKKSIVFCYGDTIYSPSNDKLSADLIAHEEVHQRQQQKMAVELWWEQYLTNVDFRLMQEVEAYRRQVLIINENYGRDQRRKLTKGIIKDLCGEMYGKIVSPETAKQLIKEENDE